jgi:hypothetical protein
MRVADAPVRVIAFNMLGHWADDVSRQITDEIQKRCDLAGEPVPERIRDFVEDHTGPTSSADFSFKCGFKFLPLK